MSGRPACKVRLSRDDPLPSASCPTCQRTFHAQCLAPAAPGIPVCCCTCADIRQSASTTSRNTMNQRPAATSKSTPTESPSSPAPSDLLATPPPEGSSLKRPSSALSTPSPSSTPAHKTYCASSPPLQLLSAGAAAAFPATPAMLPHPHQPTGGESTQAFSDAQPYFLQFLNLFQQSDARNVASLNEIMRVVTDNAIKSLVARVEVLEANQDVRISEQKAEVSAVRADLARVSAAQEAFSRNRSLDDPREILIRGIPTSLNHSPSQITAAFLSALELPHLAPLVTACRSWDPKPRDGRRNRAPASASGSVSAPSAHAPRPAASQTRALVITLACPATRDNIFKKTPALRGIDCQTIFGTGGDAKLSVTALWPSPVYELLMRAIIASMSLNYERPIVRNLVVFERSSRSVAPIPVYSEFDLDGLPANPT